jgi:hypothetical protein
MGGFSLDPAGIGNDQAAVKHQVHEFGMQTRNEEDLVL